MALETRRDLLAYARNYTKLAKDILAGEGIFRDEGTEHPAFWVHVFLPWWTWFGLGLVHFFVRQKLWDILRMHVAGNRRLFIIVR